MQLSLDNGLQLSFDCGVINDPLPEQPGTCLQSLHLNFKDVEPGTSQRMNKEGMAPAREALQAVADKWLVESQEVARWRRLAGDRQANARRLADLKAKAAEFHDEIANALDAGKSPNATEEAFADAEGQLALLEAREGILGLLITSAAVQAKRELLTVMEAERQRLHAEAEAKRRKAVTAIEAFIAKTYPDLHRASTAALFTGRADNVTPITEAAWFQVRDAGPDAVPTLPALSSRQPQPSA